MKSDSEHAAVAETVSKQNWKDQKAKEAEERKLRNRIAKLEEQIASCEQKIQEIDEAMQSPEICTNSFELNRLTEEKASVEETLLLAMTEWEELQSNI